MREVCAKLLLRNPGVLSEKIGEKWVQLVLLDEETVMPLIGSDNM